MLYRDKNEERKNRMNVKIPMENGNGTMVQSPRMFEREKMWLKTRPTAEKLSIQRHGDEKNEIK